MAQSFERGKHINAVFEVIADKFCILFIGELFKFFKQKCFADTADAAKKVPEELSELMAMDNPGKIFRTVTKSGNRVFTIKALQLTSKGGIIRTMIILEPKK